MDWEIYSERNRIQYVKFNNPSPPQIRKSDVHKQVGSFWSAGTPKSLSVYVIGDRSEDYSSTSNDKEIELMKTAKAMVIGCMIIFSLQSLMSFGLFIGAVKKNVCLCKIWAVISALIVVSTIIVAIWGSTVGRTGMITPHVEVHHPWIMMILTCFGTANLIYLLWVVVAFIQQMQQVEQMGINSIVELGGQLGEEGDQPVYVYQPFSAATLEAICGEN
ncbi:unnamed protein product [Orchesella dallaii]|uniref:Uncharacterized protein n=1 Tax=Orchesella dallaii TaxID=48710 RepID=A0ABP1R0V7_9HEXA